MWESYEDLHKIMKNLWTDRDSINVMEFERVVDVYKTKQNNPTLHTSVVGNSVAELQEGRVQYKDKVRNVPIAAWGPHIQTFANDSGLSFVDTARLFLEIQDRLFGDDALQCVGTAMITKVINEAYAVFYTSWGNLLGSLSELFSLELSMHVDPAVNDDHPLYVSVRAKTDEQLKENLIQNLCTLLVKLHTTSSVYFKLNYYTLTRSITSLLFTIVTSMCRPLSFNDLSLVYNTQCDLVRLLNNKEHPGSHLFVSIVMLEACTLSCLQVKCNDLLNTYSTLQNKLEVLIEQHGESSRECQAVVKDISKLQSTTMSILDGIFNLSIKLGSAADQNQVHGGTLRMAIAVAVAVLEPLLPTPVELSVVEPMVLSFLRNKGSLRFWADFLLQVPHLDSHPQFADAVNSVGYLVAGLFNHYGLLVHSVLDSEDGAQVDPSSTGSEETSIHWLLRVVTVYIGQVPTLGAALLECPEFVSLLLRTLHSNNSYSGIYKSASLSSLDMTFQSPLFKVVAPLLSALTTSGAACSEQVFQLLAHSTKYTLEAQLKKLADLHALQTGAFVGRVGGSMGPESKDASFSVAADVLQILTGLASHPAALSAMRRFAGGQNQSFVGLLCAFLNLRCPLLFKRRVLETLGAIAREGLDAAVEVLIAFTSVYIPPLAEISTRISTAKSTGVSLHSELKQSVPHSINIMEAQTYLSNPTICSASTVPSLNCSSIFFALTQNTTAKVPLTHTREEEPLADSFIHEVLFQGDQNNDLGKAYLLFVQSCFVSFTQYPRKPTVGELTHRFVENASGISELNSALALLPSFVEIVIQFVYLVRPLRKNTSVCAMMEIQDTCLRVLTSAENAYVFVSQFMTEADALQSRGSLYSVLALVQPHLAKTRAAYMVKLITQSALYDSFLGTVRAVCSAVTASDLSNCENNLFAYTADVRSSQLVQGRDTAADLAVLDISFQSVLQRVSADKDAIQKYQYMQCTQGKPDAQDKAKYNVRQHSLDHTCCHCLNSLAVVTVGTSARVFESVLESVMQLVGSSCALSSAERDSVQSFYPTSLLKDPIKLLQQSAPHLLKDLLFLSSYKLTVENYSYMNESLRIQQRSVLQQQLESQAIAFHQVVSHAVAESTGQEVSAVMSKLLKVGFFNGSIPQRVAASAGVHCGSLLRRDAYAVSRHACRAVLEVLKSRGGERFFASVVCGSRETRLLRQAFLRSVGDLHRSDCLVDSDEVQLLQSLLLPPAVHEQMLAIQDQNLCGNSIAADTGVVTLALPVDGTVVDVTDSSSLVEVDTIDIPYSALHACMNTMARSVRYAVDSSTRGAATKKTVQSSFDDIQALHALFTLQILELGVAKNVPLLLSMLDLHNKRELLYMLCTQLESEQLQTSHPVLAAEALHLLLQLLQSEHRACILEQLASQSPLFLIKLLSKIPANYLQVLVENEFGLPFEPVTTVPVDVATICSKYSATNAAYKNVQLFIAIQYQLAVNLLVQFVTSTHGQTVATVLLGCLRLCAVRPELRTLHGECELLLGAQFARQQYYTTCLKQERLYGNHFSLCNEFVNVVGLHKTTFSNTSYLELLKPFFSNVTCNSAQCFCSTRTIVFKHLEAVNGDTSIAKGGLFPGVVATCDVLHETNCHGVRSVVSLLTSACMSLSKQDVASALQVLNLYLSVYSLDERSNTLFTRDAVLTCMMNVLHIFTTLAEGSFASLIRTPDKAFSLNGLCQHLISQVHITPISSLRVKIYSLLAMLLQSSRDSDDNSINGKTNNINGNICRAVFETKQQGTQGVDALIRCMNNSNNNNNSNAERVSVRLSRTDIDVLVNCIAADEENYDLTHFCLVAVLVSELYRVLDHEEQHARLYSKWLQVCHSMLSMHARVTDEPASQVMLVVCASCFCFTRNSKVSNLDELISALIQPMAAAFTSQGLLHIDANNVNRLSCLDSTQKCVLLVARHSRNTSVLTKVALIMQSLYTSTLSFLLQREFSTSVMYTLSIFTLLNRHLSHPNTTSSITSFCHQLSEVLLYNCDRWLRTGFSGSTQSDCDIVTFTTCMLDFIFSFRAVAPANIVSIRNSFGELVPLILQCATNKISAYASLSSMLQSAVSVLEKDSSIPSFLVHNLVTAASSREVAPAVSPQVQILTTMMPVSSSTSPTSSTKEGLDGASLFSVRLAEDAVQSSSDVVPDTQQKTRQAVALCGHIRRYAAEKAQEALTLAERQLTFVLGDTQDKQVRAVWTGLLQGRELQDVKRIRIDGMLVDKEAPPMLTDLLRVVTQATDTLHLQNTGFTKAVVEKLTFSLRK